ncbi:Solute carrier family 22 member 13 [Takifugu flavidus]|uniref:Solute carrier family 22 member 13 n=1 Tax=Takifugu flavidus TaxID=433684 RepID=A0A5C6NW85_9TELE|nr:Solute carrier family 22 member 13 [Takifugu flavidus]
MQLVIISPALLLVGLYYWLLPESARWLLTQGKKEAAQKELQRAARVNRREIPEILFGQLEMEPRLKRDNLLDLFKTSYLRKLTFIFGFTRSSCYGHSFGCVGEIFHLRCLQHILYFYNRELSNQFKALTLTQLLGQALTLTQLLGQALTLTQLLGQALTLTQLLGQALQFVSSQGHFSNSRRISVALDQRSSS